MTNTIRRIIILSLCATPFLLSCAGVNLVRSNNARGGNGIPSIAGITDLGGLPLPASGNVTAGESDGVITPGEWIALNGTNLAADTEYAVDGATLRPYGYFENGSVLFRAPGRMSPRGDHRFTAKNPRGEASFAFKITSYVVTADFDGSDVRAIPSLPEGKKFLSDDFTDLDISGAKIHAISPERSLLAIISTVDKDSLLKGINNKLILVNMAAKNRPAEIARVNTPGVTLPTALAFIDEQTIVILGTSSITLVDITAPRKPAVRATLDLSKEAKTTDSTIPQFLNAIAVLGNGRCAIMDAVSNRVILVSVSTDGMRSECVYDLPESGNLPYTIDIAADPDNADACFVLQGPNLRVGGEKIKRFITSFASSGKEEHTEISVPCRVLRVSFNGGKPALLGKKILGDRFFPMYMCAGKNDLQYVSGINGDVLNFAGVDLSMEGVGKIVNVMKDTMQLGRVMKLSGNSVPETCVQGMAMYFNIDMIGDDIAYSMIRAGYKVLPPGVTAEWGVEVRKGGYVMLKRLEYKSIIPPYSLPVFVCQ